MFNRNFFIVKLSYNRKKIAEWQDSSPPNPCRGRGFWCRGVIYHVPNSKKGNENCYENFDKATKKTDNSLWKIDRALSVMMIYLFLSKKKQAVLKLKTGCFFLQKHGFHLRKQFSIELLSVKFTF